MSQPIAVNILSDDEDGDCGNEALSTPLQTQSKKQRLLFDSNPTVFVIDDDPTPRKPSSDPISTPSFVAETPLSDFSIHSVSVVKCPIGLASSSMFEPKSPGINKLICLESDNESGIGSWRKTWKQNETTVVASQVGGDLELNPKYLESSFSLCDNSLHQIALEDDIPQAHDVLGKEIDGLEPITKDLRQKGKTKHSATTENKMDEASRRKRITKEERTQMMEEKKQQKEQERLQKAALKAEAAEMKKLQKEMQKWEKGKVALKSIMAEIDTKVVELGSVGGHLLTGFGEKGLSYRVTSNPIARSIVWTMTVPEQILQIASRCSEIAYVLLVYDAEEFCSLILNGSLMDHVSSVQSRYPSHTICFLTNRLMAYINRREQGQYKNPDTYVGWRRPPVEEALSKLSTHFFGVHSRQCVDEAELADHVVGLTCSLASCQFRVLEESLPRCRVSYFRRSHHANTMVTRYKTSACTTSHCQSKNQCPCRPHRRVE